MIKKITTIVDGYDVKKVNLWPSPTNRNKKIAVCFNNEKVFVLGRSGDYSRVRTLDGRIGWCANGFITALNNHDQMVDNVVNSIEYQQQFFEANTRRTNHLLNLLSRLWIVRILNKFK